MRTIKPSCRLALVRRPPSRHSSALARRESGPVRHSLLGEGGFTMVELLAVIAVIAILAGLLLPVLGTAKEKGNRIACSSNLHQIGLAILAFAADNDNHTPSALNNGGTPPSAYTDIAGQTPWYTVLTNGYVNSTKIFLCPDDRRRPTPPGVTPRVTPRSYAIFVGASGAPANYWIAGSRLTCPWLTNSQVAVVGESYSGTIVPTIENTVQSATDPICIQSSSDTYEPSSKHEKSSALAGNFLFLDGHVEWVQNPENAQKQSEMFPTNSVPAGVACP